KVAFIFVFAGDRGIHLVQISVRDICFRSDAFPFRPDIDQAVEGPETQALTHGIKVALNGPLANQFDGMTWQRGDVTVFHNAAYGHFRKGESFGGNFDSPSFDYGLLEGLAFEIY